MCVYAAKFIGTPCQTRNSASTSASGKSTYRTARVTSTQKLPSVEDSARAEAAQEGAAKREPGAARKEALGSQSDEFASSIATSTHRQ